MSTTTMKPSMLKPRYPSYPVTGNAPRRFPVQKTGSTGVHPTPMQHGSRGPLFARPPFPSLR